jgi:hypothetical protein
VAYSQLDRTHLVDTVARLHLRIRERFPNASLVAVAGELKTIVERHAERSAAIRRPVWRLRLVSAALLLAAFALLVLLLLSIHPDRRSDDWSLATMLQSVEAGLSTAFFLGAGCVYVASLELRSKRRRCLEALHELRALAHIVDLHQLTKDPDQALHPGAEAAANGERPLDPFQLGRYLDYCSEMLSLIGKASALYAQDFPDPQAVEAVDAIEDLTTGLSRKIWQKIMILSSHDSAHARERAEGAR